MRSSSNSVAVRGFVAPAAVGVASWTPDVIAGGPAGPTSRAPAESPDDLVRNAAIAVWEEACMREVELLRREAETREQLLREAYAKGFEAGRAEGEVAEGARLRTAVLAAEEALDELRAGEVRWTGTIEENVCALGVVIARQIVGRELAADIQPVVDLVRNAMSEFPIDQPIRIRLNPSDLSALNSVADGSVDPLANLTPNPNARWLPDPAIAPGGCVVEGRERIIDGRIDTALERVYRRLTYTNA